MTNISRQQQMFENNVKRLEKRLAFWKEKYPTALAKRQIKYYTDEISIAKGLVQLRKDSLEP